MSYVGTLYDTVKDSYSVKAQAKVSGYDWGGTVTTSSSTPVNKCAYDPAAQYVNYGWVQVCVDRGILPDQCVGTAKMTR